ncbi:MAG: class I SAM-dependent methyltransferase [Planctomycetes bacterium]|nr:class I SAM-dependent methyltransferase [Planctomycetota bacterium]
MELQMLAAGEYAWTGEADPIRYYRVPVVGKFFRRRVARCIDLLPGGESVLEIGYGSGVAFLNLAQLYHTIHGIDVHDRVKEVARSFESLSIQPRLRQGDITRLPYDDNSFDSALAISVHEEIPFEQQRHAFSEVHRVLRPGGCYVVGVPGVNVLMNSALKVIGCDVTKYHVTTDAQVLNLMRERFTIESVRYNPRFLPKSLTTYVCIRGRKTG